MKTEQIERYPHHWNSRVRLVSWKEKQLTWTTTD